MPIYLLMALSLIKIRKNFGMLTAGLFIFCLVTMPMFIQYALEVRMYSWSIFFVTTSFIFIYEIIERNSYKNWIILYTLFFCIKFNNSLFDLFSIYFKG